MTEPNRPPKLPPPIPELIDREQTQSIDKGIAVGFVAILFVLFLLLLFLIMLQGAGGGSSELSQADGDTTSQDDDRSSASTGDTSPEGTSSSPESNESTDNESTDNESSNDPNQTSSSSQEHPSAESDVGKEVSVTASISSTTYSFAAVEQGTGFFGLPDGLGYCIFVLDCSSSMAGPKWERTKTEFLNTVRSSEQLLEVGLVCFNSNGVYDPNLIHRNKDDDTILEMANWIDTVSPSSGTFPEEGLAVVSNQSPKAFYLLSDGEFDHDSKKKVIALANGIPVHCVSLSARSLSLQFIAEQTGGQYVEAR